MSHQQKTHTKKFDDLISKSIAVKRATLEALLLDYAPVSHTSVVKGTKLNNQDSNNMSQMTDSTHRKNTEKDKHYSMSNNNDNSK